MASAFISRIFLCKLIVILCSIRTGGLSDASEYAYKSVSEIKLASRSLGVFTGRIANEVSVELLVFGSISSSSFSMLVSFSLSRRRRRVRTVSGVGVKRSNEATLIIE